MSETKIRVTLVEVDPEWQEAHIELSVIRDGKEVVPFAKLSEYYDGLPWMTEGQYVELNPAFLVCLSSGPAPTPEGER